jgi:hypothetical protein
MPEIFTIGFPEDAFCLQGRRTSDAGHHTAGGNFEALCG